MYSTWAQDIHAPGRILINDKLHREIGFSAISLGNMEGKLNPIFVIASRLKIKIFLGPWNDFGQFLGYLLLRIYKSNRKPNSMIMAFFPKCKKKKKIACIWCHRASVGLSATNRQRKVPKKNGDVNSISILITVENAWKEILYNFVIFGRGYDWCVALKR